MRVMFINNEGSGFADYVEVPEGMTIKAFFDKHVGADRDPHDYLIRVNRLPSAADQVLQENDRITCTPTKVEGANALTLVVAFPIHHRGRRLQCQCHSAIFAGGVSAVCVS